MVQEQKETHQAEPQQSGELQVLYSQAASSDHLRVAAANGDSQALAELARHGGTEHAEARAA